MVDNFQKIFLLEQLYKNSRISSSHLEEKMGLSRQSISKIKNFLWNKKIIYKPTFILNPHVLNLQFFFMEIKTNPSEPRILEAISKFEEISAFDGILGDYSLIIKFEVQTKKKFAEILAQIDKNISKSLFSSYRIIECIDIFKVGGFILNRNHPVKALDENDKKWELLQLLKRNFNLKKWDERENEHFFSTEEKKILEKINLSRTFSNFQEDHIIQNFTIILNNEKFLQLMSLGAKSTKEPDLSTKFYIQIQPKHIGFYTTLAFKLIHEPNIIDLYRTGDEAGLLAVVRTKGLRGLNLFLKKIYNKYEIMNTHTTVVVDEILPTIHPPTIKIADEICNNSNY